MKKISLLIVCAWVAFMPGGLGAGVVAAADSPPILTFHGDVARTGWIENEQVLTPATVRSASFAKLWSTSVEGEIYAEPLVSPGVGPSGADQGGRAPPHPGVFVVTEHDLVYAFDATNGKRLWGPISLGTPVPRATLACGNIDPVGITSTPVIDQGSQTLYLVGLTTPDGGTTKRYLIAALDLKNGKMRSGWPIPISPPPSSGFRFNPGVQQQRGALALLNGVVYIPFGGYLGDCGDYHGWVVAVPVEKPTDQQAFATPTHRMGGIWATGGIAADPAGYLYAATGNSDSPDIVDLGNSVIRLTPFPKLRFSGTSKDFFTPSNFVQLNDTDQDLGSSAPLVLPHQRGSTTPNLIFIAGKQGVGYLINRDDMGGVSKGNGITGEGIYSRCVSGACQNGYNQVFSASAYWDGGRTGQLIFVPGRGRQPAPCRGQAGIVALRLRVVPGSGASAFDVAWCSRSMTQPGAPSVTGAGPDGGIVWVIDNAQPAILYAFDAATGAELYASTGADSLRRARQFITPAAVGGHVYVGAGNEVAAYGLKAR